MDSDFNYFSRRAEEERTAAMQAAHPRARRSHQDLAARYEDLASAIATTERYMGMRLPSLA